MNNEIFTVLYMWLIPPIVLLLVLWQSVKTGYLSFYEGVSEGSRWLLVNILLCIAIFVCVFFQAEIRKTGWNAAWWGYALFEYVGSWVVGGIFLINLNTPYGVKQKHLNQSFSFNINLKDLGPNKFLVRLERNEYSKSGSYNLILYRSILAQDYSGEYVTLKQEHVFETKNLEEYTKDKIVVLLKDYFDNRKVFTTDTDCVMVEVSRKEPEVLIIK